VLWPAGVVVCVDAWALDGLYWPAPFAMFATLAGSLKLSSLGLETVAEAETRISLFLKSKPNRKTEILVQFRFGSVRFLFFS
jgi:hypothetical protein